MNPFGTDSCDTNGKLDSDLAIIPKSVPFEYRTSDGAKCTLA